MKKRNDRLGHTAWCLRVGLGLGLRRVIWLRSLLYTSHDTPRINVNVWSVAQKDMPFTHPSRLNVIPSKLGHRDEAVNV